MMLEHVADVYTAPDKCREYFAVVKAMVRRAMKHGALDTASVALRMIRRLRNHPVVERTASDEGMAAVLAWHSFQLAPVCAKPSRVRVCGRASFRPCPPGIHVHDFGTARRARPCHAWAPQ